MSVLYSTAYDAARVSVPPVGAVTRCSSIAEASLSLSLSLSLGGVGGQTAIC
jgi:hypothetical protein